MTKGAGGGASRACAASSSRLRWLSINASLFLSVASGCVLRVSARANSKSQMDLHHNLFTVLRVAVRTASGEHGRKITCGALMPCPSFCYLAHNPYASNDRSYEVDALD